MRYMAKDIFQNEGRVFKQRVVWKLWELKTRRQVQIYQMIIIKAYRLLIGLRKNSFEKYYPTNK